MFAWVCVVDRDDRRAHNQVIIRNRRKARKVKARLWREIPRAQPRTDLPLSCFTGQRGIYQTQGTMQMLKVFRMQICARGFFTAQPLLLFVPGRRPASAHALCDLLAVVSKSCPKGFHVIIHLHNFQRKISEHIEVSKTGIKNS